MENNKIASTPRPPYYAVIFTSLRSSNDAAAYAAMAAEMETLACEQPGFLGMESARDGLGITVSYWESPEAIRAWKNHPRHRIAQQAGREHWYQAYKTRICKVERDYDFDVL